MPAPNVKWTRDIVEGCSGKDVVAHKRAISRAVPLRYPWHEFTPYAGSQFIRAVIGFKQSKNMNSIPMLGRTCHEVLERTHAKEKPKEWAFDPPAIALAAAYYQAAHDTPDQQARDAIVSAGFFWYEHRTQIAYSQFRPFQLGKPTWVPSRWDCSAFVTACHYAGGAPDPNGRGYDHLGYTGTLTDHGLEVNDITMLKPGDMVFYGHAAPSPGFPGGAPTHVALYVGLRNGEHRVLSMGHYPMSYYTYDYRTDINHYRHYKVT